jgi:hypothetical protein
MAGQGALPHGGAGPALNADAGAEQLPEPPEPGDYAVVCQDGNSGATATAQFSVRLSLLNYTDERIPVEELTVRYWFTSDNEHDPALLGHQVHVDDAGPAWGERGNVLTAVGAVDPPEDGADTYVEVSFGAGDCGGVACTWPTTPGTTVAPEQRPVQLRVQIDPSALRYDLSNDYSFDPDARGQTLCETVTLYRQGVLIFGTEPDGTTAAPTTDGGVPTGADAGTPTDAGAGGQGGAAGGAGGQDAGSVAAPDADASLPEPEPAPVPDAGTSSDASVEP